MNKVATRRCGVAEKNKGRFCKRSGRALPRIPELPDLPPRLRASALQVIGSSLGGRLPDNWKNGCQSLRWISSLLLLVAIQAAGQSPYHQVVIQKGSHP